MRQFIRNLDTMLSPRSVAVIGASNNPEKLGYQALSSVTGCGFHGNIYPVRPGVTSLMGHQAWASVRDISDPVDLAIVCVPSPYVRQVTRDCAAKGVGGMVIITSGFGEIEDYSGSDMQIEIARIANAAEIPIIGPNTFGFVNTHISLNATFSPHFGGGGSFVPGNVTLAAQSGGMSGIISNSAAEGGLHFSKLIGLGNRCNVDFAEIIEYLGTDQTTKVICLYMEGIDQPRQLDQAMRQKAGGKPLVIYKAGHWDDIDRAAKSHTGSMAGRYEIYEAAFRKAGVLPVHSSDDLIDAAKILSLAVLPQGRNVAVLTAQAGLGIAACGAMAQHGLHIPMLSGRTKKMVEQLLPPLSLRSNPVDTAFAWSDFDRTRKIIHALIEDPDIHSLLYMTVYGTANRSVIQATAETLKEAGRKKPTVTCFSAPMGVWDDDIAALERGGIPNYPSPERAGRALANLTRYALARIE